LHELSIIDDILEALGAPKEYQWLRSWIIRIIIGWIVYIFYDLTSILFYLRYGDKMLIEFVVIYEIFLMIYPNIINILNAMIWETMLRFVSTGCLRMIAKYFVR